jgi:hypothetical protein
MGTITIKVPQNIHLEYEVDNTAIMENLLDKLQSLVLKADVTTPDRLLGLFADKAELLDAVTESVMQARERDALRIA